MALWLLPAAEPDKCRRHTVVTMGAEVPGWLHLTLKHFKIKTRVITSVAHELERILSGDEAVWEVGDLALEKLETPGRYQQISVQAHVVHVDMAAESRMSLKLTLETIEHPKLYLDSILHEKRGQTAEANRKWQIEEVVGSLGVYAFRTQINALQGINSNGSSTLPEANAIEVRHHLMAMLRPLQFLAFGRSEPAPPPWISPSPSPPGIGHDQTSRSPVFVETYLWQCPSTGQQLLVTTTAHAWQPEQSLCSVTGEPANHKTFGCDLPVILTPWRKITLPSEVSKMQRASTWYARSFGVGRAM